MVAHNCVDLNLNIGHPPTSAVQSQELPATDVPSICPCKQMVGEEVWKDSLPHAVEQGPQSDTSVQTERKGEGKRSLSSQGGSILFAADGVYQRSAPRQSAHGPVSMGEASSSVGPVWRQVL